VNWNRRYPLPIDIRFFFAYAGIVPHVCKCQVSFTDSVGVTHMVEVPADSLYEAAALAIAEFRRCGFAEVIPGPATRLTVAVESPATTHELPISKLEAWLDSSAKSPHDHILKQRLRELVGR
jgi:hypothetical protein